MAAGDVYVLAGAGRTVYAFPSALHQGAGQQRLYAGPVRRLRLVEPDPAPTVRRRREDVAYLAAHGQL